MERKIGLSLGLNFLQEPFFEKMMTSGVSAVEISCSPDHYPQLDYKAIRRAADSTGVTLWSFHYPFSPFTTLNLASFDSEVRRASVAYLSELTRRASDIGISRFVVHASGEPIADGDREESMKFAAESLAQLSHVAKASGAVIAVEDLPRTCLGNCHQDILRLIGDDPTLGVCFDSNHLTGERGEDFLAAVGHRLITVHLSDFDFINERHWLPGEGKIDWRSMMRALDATGYAGPLLYELSFSSTKTIERKRPLEPADFAENAAALMSGQIPAPMDIPYPDLGMWGRK